jgi:hypothetical protein
MPQLKRSAFVDVAGLIHATNIEGNLPFGIDPGEVGAFEGAFAGGKKILAIDRTDPLAAVVRAGGWIDGALTKHGETSRNKLNGFSLVPLFWSVEVGDKWSILPLLAVVFGIFTEFWRHSPDGLARVDSTVFARNSAEL